jgi:hypothetical protein
MVTKTIDQEPMLCDRSLPVVDEPTQIPFEFGVDTEAILQFHDVAAPRKLIDW